MNDRPHRAGTQKVVVPYGEQTKTLSIPAENLAWVVGPKDEAPLNNLRDGILKPIRSPINSPTISELVKRHGTKTVILVDDGTRSTPQAVILPILIDELNAAGVPDRDITILIALGTHRPMSKDECIARYGQEVVDRVRVENLSQDANDFVDLGVTPRGVPIFVSRLYLNSNMSIAVGNIVPHMYAGWAGGAKMVQPGITSPETTAKTHLVAGTRVYEILGQVNNPVRLEMEDIAIKSGLKFIVNVVLNRRGQVVDVVAGDMVAAHRAGVDIARPIYTVEIDKQPDIVIASSHPADRDLWQGIKAINNCGMLIKNAGTLILITPAFEGIAPDHQEFVELGTTPANKVLEMIDNGQISDGVAAATYLALDQTRRRVNITVVTDGITNDQAGRMGLAVTQHFEQALAAALARHGNKAQIGVVTHGGDIMGRFR